MRGILPSVLVAYGVRNEIKNLFWMFTFENFIKETKVSVSTMKLKGFKA